MASAPPSLDLLEKSQWFPLYDYDIDESGHEGESTAKEVAKSARAPKRRDGITDAGLAHFQSAYPGETITKEDVFYYVYGILHSRDYRERYADNLGKELPRIPRVKTPADFWAFSKAGRALGELHVGYEKVAEYAGVTVTEPQKPTSDRKALYRVEKMRFGRDKDQPGGKDKSVIVYNPLITVSGIPLEAYDYVVNGKSAIEWVMERQSVTTDKDSGIVKDANAWAVETVGDPRYPLSLLLRVITVSLETLKIVGSLPALDILDEAASSVTEPAKAVQPTAVSPTGRYTLSGSLVVASVKDRRGTFRAQEGYELTVELPLALDTRLRETDVAPDEDGLVRLRVRGRGTIEPATGRLAKLVVEDFELESPPDPDAPSEALFERLAKQDPDRLVRILKSALEPGHLTHAAEIAGRELPSAEVVPALLDLLRHPSPLVREGAVYGLSAHHADDIAARLHDLAESDPSPGVRTAAREVLGAR